MKKCPSCGFAKAYESGDGRCKCKRCGHRYRWQNGWSASRLGDSVALRGSACDETTFGGARHGKRGWGADGKVIVFGIVKRNGQVKAMPIAPLHALPAPTATAATSPPGAWPKIQFFILVQNSPDPFPTEKPRFYKVIQSLSRNPTKFSLPAGSPWFLREKFLFPPSPLSSDSIKNYTGHLLAVLVVGQQNNGRTISYHFLLFSSPAGIRVAFYRERVHNSYLLSPARRPPLDPRVGLLVSGRGKNLGPHRAWALRAQNFSSGLGGTKRRPRWQPPAGNRRTQTQCARLVWVRPCRSKRISKGSSSWTSKQIPCSEILTPLARSTSKSPMNSTSLANGNRGGRSTGQMLPRKAAPASRASSSATCRRSATTSASSSSLLCWRLFTRTSLVGYGERLGAAPKKHTPS